MYDYRGVDGTGTAANPASGANAVSYTVRKLADGNCWMTDDLKLALATGSSVVASYNDGSTFTFTPTSCSTNGACAINGNTSRYGERYYYSWYAATAGKGGYYDVGDINGSICPSGWSLPTLNGKSYVNIMSVYLGITTVTPSDSFYLILDAFPLNFSRLGYFMDGSFVLLIYNNDPHWTSTGSTQNANYMDYGDNVVVPQQYYNKVAGFSVRCVAI